MSPYVCPWWGGYFIDNRFRRLLHNPEAILAPYVKPGMTALDFGCGMGFFTIPMARFVGDEGRVIATDLQQKMLDALTKRARKAEVSEKIHTHCCEADSIGISERVDFALAFYSAHEVPDVRRLLTEIRGLLSPEGRMLLVEPIGHVSAAAFQNMVDVAEEIGFQVQGRPRIRLSRAAVLAAGRPGERGGERGRSG
jgi:ubiquinone/menaquinone biosynthesis C-methylase UbiE